METTKQEKIFLCLYSLYERKCAQLFRHSVQHLPHYLQEISQPIYLDLILHNFKNSYYSSTHQIYEHLKLIISNCFAYNSKYNSNIFTKIQSICLKFKRSTSTVWYALMRELTKDKEKAEKKQNKGRESFKHVIDIFSGETTSEQTEKNMEVIFENFDIDVKPEIRILLQKIEERRKLKVSKVLKKLGNTLQNTKNIEIINLQTLESTPETQNHKQKITTRSSTHKFPIIKQEPERTDKFNHKFQNIKIKVDSFQRMFSDVAHDEKYIIKKEIRCDESFQGSVKDDSYENKLKSVEQLNGRSLIFLQRKLRKHRITLKRELQFIRNRILTSCINQKSYSSFKMPQFLINFIQKSNQDDEELPIFQALEQDPGQTPQPSYCSSVVSFYEKYWMISLICDVYQNSDGFQQNKRGIMSVFFLIQYVCEYLKVHEGGFEVCILRKAEISLKQLSECLKEISKEFGFCRQNSFLSKKNHFQFKDRHLTISKQFQTYIFQKFPHFEELQDNFLEKYQFDKFYIETNLILYKTKQKNKYITGEELNHVYNRKKGLSLRKKLQFRNQRHKIGYEESDEQFIEDVYKLRSNKMIIEKFGKQKLQINWDIAKGFHKISHLEIPFSDEFPPFVQI